MVALAEIIPLTALIVVIACILLIEAIVHGLFRPLTALPAVGGAIGRAEVTIIQSLNSALGLAVSGIEVIVGTSWHSMARLADWLWREIRSHANLIVGLAGPLSALLLAYQGVKALVHQLTRTNTHSDARLKNVARELTHIEHQIKALEHDVSKGIGDDLLPRLKTLDKEVARINNKTIPAIQAADAQASSAISDLWTWIHKNIAIPGTTAFTAAVAVALTALGLGNLRCPSFGRFLNKWGCGLGGLLDGLLGLVISALALENVCTLLPILETAFGEVVGPVTHLLTEVPLGGCETPPKSWAQLNVAAGRLPPQQTLGTLPT